MVQICFNPTFSLGLKNDLREITKQIEVSLHSLHQQQRDGLGITEDTSILDEFSKDHIPFAKIGSVTEGSPADKAVSCSFE